MSDDDSIVWVIRAGHVRSSPSVFMWITHFTSHDEGWIPVDVVWWLSHSTCGASVFHQPLAVNSTWDFSQTSCINIGIISSMQMVCRAFVMLFRKSQCVEWKEVKWKANVCVFVLLQVNEETVERLVLQYPHIVFSTVMQDCKRTLERAYQMGWSPNTSTAS